MVDQDHWSIGIWPHPIRTLTLKHFLCLTPKMWVVLLTKANRSIHQSCVTTVDLDRLEMGFGGFGLPFETVFPSVVSKTFPIWLLAARLGRTEFNSGHSGLIFTALLCFMLFVEFQIGLSVLVKVNTGHWLKAWEVWIDHIRQPPPLRDEVSHTHVKVLFNPKTVAWILLWHLVGFGTKTIFYIDVQRWTLDMKLESDCWVRLQKWGLATWLGLVCCGAFKLDWRLTRRTSRD